MSGKLVEYRTVIVEHIVDLDREVKYFVRHGFELHGGPFSYDNAVVQAMVKYEDVEIKDQITTESRNEYES
jgi:hypothetical protein